MMLSLSKPKNINSIWKKESLCYNKLISNTMSRKRFWVLYSRFSLFSKKDVASGKIIKRPKAVQYLVSLFNKEFVPGEHKGIDGSMFTFKERILNRVYEPSKPDKFGIKLYTLCDSETSFLLRLNICGEKLSLNRRLWILLKNTQVVSEHYTWIIFIIQ